MRPLRATLGLVVCCLLAPAVLACSLCSNPVNRATLGEEMDLAPVVVYGWLSEPKLNPLGEGTPGGGTTRLHVEKVLKDEAKFGTLGQLTLSRYVPVPDPENPPHYVVFLDRRGNGFDLLGGSPAKSQAVVDYLTGARAARSAGRVPALVYYARHLGHAEEAIAQDAFFEFAKSRDADVGAAGRQLRPAEVRRLLAGARDDPDRTSLFAFLLGCCGEPADAATLARLGASLQGESIRALDGVLAGYVGLRPREGWHAIQTILGNSKQPLMTRLAAWRAVRFLRGWNPMEFGAETLRAMEPLIRDGELADLAIEDLRRWKAWDLTKLVAAQYDDPARLAPIVRNSIIRYALECPLPEARALVARARQLDPEYVADQERLLSDLSAR